MKSLCSFSNTTSDDYVRVFNIEDADKCFLECDKDKECTHLIWFNQTCLKFKGKFVENLVNGHQTPSQNITCGKVAYWSNNETRRENYLKDNQIFELFQKLRIKNHVKCFSNCQYDYNQDKDRKHCLATCQTFLNNLNNVYFNLLIANKNNLGIYPHSS